MGIAVTGGGGTGGGVETAERSGLADNAIEGSCEAAVAADANERADDEALDGRRPRPGRNAGGGNPWLEEDGVEGRLRPGVGARSGISAAVYAMAAASIESGLLVGGEAGRLGRDEGRGAGVDGGYAVAGVGGMPFCPADMRLDVVSGRPFAYGRLGVTGTNGTPFGGVGARSMRENVGGGGGTGCLATVDRGIQVYSPYVGSGTRHTRSSIWVS